MISLTPIQNTKGSAEDVSKLLDELKKFKKESARLAILNDLNARLAAAVDLPAMVEVFSA